MLRAIKLQLLQAIHATGLNRRLADSEWRRRRLLILCYHGISLDDEHEWNPALFMAPKTLERRFETLREGGYRVLPLTEAAERLAQGSLPPRSVVLTFDDGTTDFRTVALPILQKFGYPSTVYVRTDYCSFRRPVFPPVGPYLLWKRRDSVVPACPELGWAEAQDLRATEGRSRAWGEILRISQQREPSAEQHDRILERMALHIGIDYTAFVESRIMQIMSAAEIAAIARAGVDVQLHTHHHRLVTALGQGDELRSEIEENRRRIFEMTGRTAAHFCYPSGKYSLESLSALRQLDIMTATTCEPDLASKSSDPLLLPRYIDSNARSESEFEAWLSGAGSLVANLRANRTRTRKKKSPVR